MALAVCLLFLFYLTRPATRATPGVEVISRMTAFSGGTFEASGVVAIAGTDAVLFVDDGRPGLIFWMNLDESGRQAGPIKAIELGVEIQDLEGATSDGTYFYVVSSQSRPKAAEKAGIVRFKLNTRTQRVEGAQSIQGLKSFLVDNVAELRRMGDVKMKDGGINIEGIAWDPKQNRFLLGLRAPVIDGQALVIPLRLKNAAGDFSVSNLEVVGSKAIRLNVGGVGIRSIEYDNRQGLFRIISGAAEDQEQTDFGLWQWSGDEGGAPPKELSRYDRRLKPEGAARVTVRGRDFMFMVFDASGYSVVE
ncbi:MAG TPA: DUF3616 domain-containing protein [Pyrinomonadaceae bacterium]|nr:DUF3616 domain-containing protein [Pyrinomonadaceae bacterium]